MNKNLLRTAVTAALTVTFAVPVFANPFSDVAEDHWAYDAVEALAQEGVIEGYGDGTFAGDKQVTRYEMAQMIAKAMHSDLNNQQKATVEKLAKEFSKELRSLGEDVADVKAEQERVKITGDARVRYGAAEGNDEADFRVRLNVDGQINEDMKLNTRISSGNIQKDSESVNTKIETANVQFNALGLDNKLGRQDLLVGTGSIIDDKINGFSTEYGDLKLFAGNQVSENERLYGAEFKTNIFSGMNFDYIKADVEDGDDKEFYGVNTTIGLTKGIDLMAEYNKENKSGDTAAAYGLSFNKLGLSATYRDVEAGAHTNYSTVSGDINNVSFLSEGYKGMEYKFTKEVAANTDFTLKYQDFKNQNGDKKEDRTAAYLNVSF